MDITAKHAFEILKDDPAIVLLDVRTEDEFEEFKLDKARLMDVYDDFQQKISVLDKGKTYVVYCRTGARSRHAMSIMKKSGFDKVYNLAGGIMSWISAGYPTIR